MEVCPDLGAENLGVCIDRSHATYIHENKAEGVSVGSSTTLTLKRLEYPAQAKQPESSAVTDLK
jgi:hypothetical protein